MLSLSSCDRQGTVHIDTDFVYRIVPDKHAYSVLKVFSILKKNCVDGVVETEICMNAKTRASLGEMGSSSLILKHKKISYISYPHEWCALMLQDAAKFHISLSQRLFGLELYLKDAHPWNILFENGQPIFIDFTSIVSKNSLFEEDYLKSNTVNFIVDKKVLLIDLHKEIYVRMFVPYFINPLIAYSFCEREFVKKLIEDTTLNASSTTIGFRNFLPKISLKFKSILQLFYLFKIYLKMKKIVTLLTINKNLSFFYKSLEKLIHSIDISIDNSPYSHYYSLKSESYVWDYNENWVLKQKSVFKALIDPQIGSVLDIACNTGWYAVLAAKLGKKVVAFDIDECCVEILYKKVKAENLNILPLVIDFMCLTKDRYSIYDGKTVLINAECRLKSDSVLALGIIHHLVLGLGLSFDLFVDALIKLTNKKMIIEFVNPDDMMIRNEPEFFKSYFKDKSVINSYSLDNLIFLIKNRGFDVRVEPSHPQSRSILVCNKVIRN